MLNLYDHSLNNETTYITSCASQTMNNAISKYVAEKNEPPMMGNPSTPVPTTSYTVRACSYWYPKQHTPQPKSTDKENSPLYSPHHPSPYLPYHLLSARTRKKNYHHSNPGRNNYCHTYLVRLSFCSGDLFISLAIQGCYSQSCHRGFPQSQGMKRRGV